MNKPIEQLNEEQKTFIRQIYKEFLAYFEMAPIENIDARTCQDIIYRVERELAYRDLANVITPSEERLFCWLLVKREYSNDLLSLFKDTLQEF